MLSPEKGNRSTFQNIVFCRITRWWTNSNPDRHSVFLWNDCVHLPDYTESSATWICATIESSNLVFSSLISMPVRDSWVCPVAWSCRSQKRSTMQWRTAHNCHHHQSAEQREARDGERTTDAVALPQRVGGTGISLRQPKLRNDMSPARVAQTNWTFVETLLKVRPVATTALLWVHCCELIHYTVSLVVQAHCFPLNVCELFDL
jgi:hypothetical protein